MPDLDQIALDTVEAIAKIDPDKLKGGRVQAMAQAQCLVRDAMRVVEAERDEAFSRGKQAFEDLRRVEAEHNSLSAYVRGALGHWDVSPEEAMANAHLIAAAHELYEALRVMMRLHELSGSPDGDVTTVARAALAKARGEQS